MPTQKCFKFSNILNNNLNSIRFYSTAFSSDVNSVKFYEDVYAMKKLIINDNKNKSGILSMN